MQRKIFKSGNSIVVSLPKEYLELLEIVDGAEVSVTMDEAEQRIIITPLGTQLANAGVDQAFAKQVADFIERYRPALEALAAGE
ncbi:MAG: hypothetical protein OEZ02_04510 [Anaerolineae bacterium]|nr:hypothetical protein [Anaerolineae bacterium]